MIESCGLAGWVHDICTEEGYEVLVCNPNQEVWKWKRIKRKSDRDYALKLAKLAALVQLVSVYFILILEMAIWPSAQSDAQSSGPDPPRSLREPSQQRCPDDLKQRPLTMSTFSGRPLPNLHRIRISLCGQASPDSRTPEKLPV